MFGWFRPTCPVPAREKAWVEVRMGWLARSFGLAACRDCTPALPTAEFFPDARNGSEDAARAAFDRIRALMGVPAGRVTLEFSDAAELPAPEDDPGGALGYWVRGDPERVYISRQLLSRTDELLATAAHELAHSRLLGEDRISEQAADHELLTDLLTVYLGAGVLTANAVMRDRASRVGNREFWQLTRSGYLVERMFAYALALFAHARDESSPAWVAHLRPNVRSVFDHARRYLAKTGDTLFPEADAPGDRLTRALARIESKSAGTRVAGLWDLRTRAERVAELLPRIRPLLTDPDADVRVAAAETLASFGPAASSLANEVLSVLEGDLRPDDRRAVLDALTALGPLPREAGPVLAAELDDTQPEVSLAALRALAAVEGELTDPVRSRVEQLLSGPNLGVAEAALTFLEDMPAAEESVPAVLHILDGEPGPLAPALFDFLGHVGPPEKTVLRALRKGLRTDEPGVQQAAAWAVATRGPIAESAARELERLRDSEDMPLALAAAVALASIRTRPADALPAIRAAWTEALARLPDEGAEALVDVAADEEAVRLLAPADLLAAGLSAADWQERLFAAWGLGLLDPFPAADAALVAADRDTFWAVRVLAAWARTRNPAAKADAVAALCRSVVLPGAETATRLLLAHPAEAIAELLTVGGAAAEALAGELAADDPEANAVLVAARLPAEVRVRVLRMRDEAVEHRQRNLALAESVPPARRSTASGRDHAETVTRVLWAAASGPAG